jgi:hypothetical protein
MILQESIIHQRRSLTGLIENIMTDCAPSELSVSACVNNACCSILDVLAQHEAPGEADMRRLKINLAVGPMMAGWGVASTALPIAS